MLSKLKDLKNLPTIPLIIGSIVTMMGCLLLAGMAYAVFVPPSKGVSEARVTATRARYVTATPIATWTPVPTDTPTSTPTNPPPTDTPVPPTDVPVTYVPPTAVPPTDPPPPPEPVYGTELGFDNLRFTIKEPTNGKGLTIPFYVRVHNANNWHVPFGYLGVAAQDDAGYSVAFRKLKINSALGPDETFATHDAIKVYKVGQFNAYFVICMSANDDACDQPGADYHVLGGPIRLTITG